MTKVKRTYTLHERELPYILSPANAIRALKLEYGRCRRTVTSPAPSQERFRTGTFDIPIVSSHDIQSGKVVALGFHPQHYVVDSHGKVRSALPHQLEIRARKLLGQQRSEVVFQSDAALAEVQELIKDPYPISITPSSSSSPTHTSQGPLPVKNKLSETQEEQGGLLNAYRYTKKPLDFVDPLGLEFKAVITPENAETGEDAPVLDNLEPVQEIPVPESQLSQRHLHETVGLDTVVVGPNGHGETIGAMYGKVYDPEGNQLPGVDNQAVEAFNDALRQAEKTREYRAEGYKMAAQDAALGMAAGPAAGIVGGVATKAAGSLVSKAKGAFGALRKADVPDRLKIEEFTAPKIGKIIEAAVDGNAAVPLDKVNIYARGKVADVTEELRALQQFKQTNRKLFDTDINNAKLLDKLKSQKHNFDRSSDMARHLETVGLSDTPVNNQMITEHLLKVGNKVTAENRVWVPSILKGPSGNLQVESTWKILEDQRAYLTTLKLMPSKR